MSQAAVLQRSDPLVRSVYVRLGLKGPSPFNVAIGTAIDLPYPPEKIWQVLEDVENWSQWAGELHSPGRWLEGRTFEVGSRFEQIRHLGFPIGRQVTVETVREVVPNQMVAWWAGNGGVCNGHMWSLEVRPDGNTRVFNIEVLCGPLVFIAKPFLRSRLRKRFKASLEGLKRALELRAAKS